MSSRRQEALDYHSQGRPGKIQVSPTKPFKNQRDLSLAYTPGVAEPCLEIAKRPEDAYLLHDPGQSRGCGLQRHGGARPGQHRRARRQAGDGGQGDPLQGVRRHRRVRPRGRLDRPRRPDPLLPAARADRRGASTWRTSAPRTASTSRSGCARRCRSPCSTTTSTAPRSSRGPRSLNALELVGEGRRRHPGGVRRRRRGGHRHRGALRAPRRSARSHHAV